MRKKMAFLWMGVLLLSLFSCKDELEDRDVVDLSAEVLSFTEEKGQQTVLVKSTAEWVITCEADWVFSEVSEAKDKFLVSVDENPDFAARSAILVIRGGNCIREIDVLQKGKDLSLELTAESGVVYDLNTTYAVGVKTEQKWKASVEGDWLTLDKESGEGNDVIRMNFGTNKATMSRMAKVTVVAEDLTMRTFTLQQEEVMPSDCLHDSLALVEIYHALKGETWKEYKNWLSDAPFEIWRGVITHPNGRVKSVTISKEKIGAEGFIPTEIKYLTEMEHFSVMYGEIGGEVPNEIGRCVGLKNFVVDNYEAGLTGNLTGHLPVIVVSMPNLAGFNVTGNQMMGELPWEYAAAPCRFFKLSRNKFSGMLPGVWSQGEHSQYALDFNLLVGEIPESWGEMTTSLQFLGLAGNVGLYGDIPEGLCRSYKNGVLESLSIKGTNITPCP